MVCGKADGKKLQLSSGGSRLFLFRVCEEQRESTKSELTDVRKSLQYFKGHSVFCIMLQRSSDVNAPREDMEPENEE